VTIKSAIKAQNLSKALLNRNTNQNVTKIILRSFCNRLNLVSEFNYKTFKLHVMKKFTFLLAVMLVTVIACTFYFVNRSKKEKATAFVQKAETVPASDFDKAIEEEENLLKDPRTGKIPEDIRELELAQAREIFDKQLSSGHASRIASTVYTYQGPSNLGGRTRAIAFDVTDPTSGTILAGCVSGGLFRTTTGGTTWTRVSPSTARYSITALAQDTRVGFTHIWYYAGGEIIGNSASGSGASYRGDGVYKSVDGGLTWAKLPSSNTGSLYSLDNRADYITRIAVNPVTGHVYVARSGDIMRSLDGGTTWAYTIGDPGAGISTAFISDIIITPTGRFYASFAGAVPGGFDGVWTSPPGSGGPGTWTHLAGTGSGTTPAGWNPAASLGRVVLAYAPSSENFVYALYYIGATSPLSCVGPFVEAELFRWDDLGPGWTNLSATLPDEAGCSPGNDPFAVQTGYDLVVAVKPDVASTIFIGGTNAYRSTDAGLTWTRIGGYAGTGGYSKYLTHHPDIHDFKFGPASSSLLFCGDDGGIQRGDITATPVVWTSLNNDYRTYQYYHVAIKPELGVSDFIGGAQDNGTTTSIGGTTALSEIFTGDGVAVGLASGAYPYTQFVGFQNGPIFRRTADLLSGFVNATLTPAGTASIFVTYFYLDPDNTENLYYACTVGGLNRIQRLTNATTAVSTDWTSMTFSYTGYVRAMAATRGAYSATSRLYLGTDGGKLYRITDPVGAVAGVVPTDITPTGMTGLGTVVGISVDPTDHNKVLVVYSNYGITNIWYTADASVASPVWVAEEGGLTLPSVRSCLIVKNGATTEYYVGTSVGLYKTTALAGGATVWTQEAPSEIGNSCINSISLRPSDNTFVIGTHGSGMWKAIVSLPLPVELTEFKGSLQNENALLQWSTTAEYNSKHFELEKSFDGTNFRKIATIPAAGNSNSPLQYSYTDREPLTEKNYYRLNSVDIDNSGKLSGIVLIKVADATQDMLVLGNPFRDNIIVRFVKPPEAKGELRLTDMAGRLIARQVIGQGEQQLQFTIPSGKVAKGVYVVQAVIGGRTYKTTVIK
jgi:hypothetical protein